MGQFFVVFKRLIRDTVEQECLSYFRVSRKKCLLKGGIFLNSLSWAVAEENRIAQKPCYARETLGVPYKMAS